MRSHTFLRGLTLSINGTFNSSEQNVSFISAYNATSAIPDLSETADKYGTIGFLAYIPPGMEVLLIVGILYAYIHCYIGSPCYIIRELRKSKQKQNQLIYTVQNIDTREIHVAV